MLTFIFPIYHACQTGTRHIANHSTLIPLLCANIFFGLPTSFL